MNEVRPAPLCPALEAPDFFSRLSRRAGRLPLAATWELTTRCNLRCAHCFLPAPTPTPRDLPLAAARRLIDTLADQGVLFLLMTGGELTLRPDWPILYRQAVQRGFLVTLMTNATRIDSAFLRVLRRHPPRHIETTIYGRTAATYDAVTGRTGAFARFQAGLARLREARLPLRLKMLVTRTNVHELNAIRDWAGQEDIPFRYDAIINPRIDGHPGPIAERIPPSRMAEWLRDSNPPSPARRSGSDRLFTCGAGRQTLHIDAGGFAHPCMMWRWDPLPTANPDWVKAWKDHCARLRRRRAPARSRCRACPSRPRCFTCPALSRLETGLAGSPVDYFCDLFQD